MYKRIILEQTINVSETQNEVFEKSFSSIEKLENKVSKETHTQAFLSALALFAALLEMGDKLENYTGDKK